MSGKRYEKAFKMEALRRVLEEGQTVAEVARDLEINPETLHRWKRELRDTGDEAFRGHGKRTDEGSELEALRRENKRLKAEIQFLKKVSTYFAKDPQGGTS